MIVEPDHRHHRIEVNAVRLVSADNARSVPPASEDEPRATVIDRDGTRYEEAD